jgi:hypothetical protein
MRLLVEERPDSLTHARNNETAGRGVLPHSAKASRCLVEAASLE